MRKGVSQISDVIDNKINESLNGIYRLQYEKLKRDVLGDAKRHVRFRNFFYKKFKKEDIERMFLHPFAYEYSLRALSRYLYIVSPHYRRLINYFSQILTYNYTVKQGKIYSRKVAKNKYKNNFYDVVNFAEKMNLKKEAEKIIRIALRDGISVGVMVYANKSQSGYFIPFEPKGIRIRSVEDGVFVPSINLAMFSGNEDLVDAYGSDIKRAYKRYKEKLKSGKKVTADDVWYEFQNGYALLADDTDPYHYLPYFANLIIDVLRLRDAQDIQAMHDENANYKVLSAKIDTDDDGVPKLPYPEIEKYYNQMSGELPDGIGLLMSPWTINDHSFQENATADRDAALSAVNNFWRSAGMPNTLMGGGTLTTASAMLLAVKPDEALSFSLLGQFERIINRQIKLMNHDYLFKVSFLYQSIFNSTEVQNNLSKGAQYGLPVKLDYAASLGFTPCETIGASYIEDDILGLASTAWTTPLVSSNTQSAFTGDEGGRPTAEETGTTVGDAGEKTRDNDSNQNR